MGLRGLAILTLLAACLAPGSSASPQARVSAGVYANNVPRFNRLTGQRTESALAFIGWDQGRTWGKPYVSQDVPENPYPTLTVVWSPLAVGEPAARGNGFRDYFPGSRFFDAYGNDYYDFGSWSFVRTNDLYKAYPSKPFVVPEWGVAVDDPAFVRAFTAFVRSHRRVKFIGFYNLRTGGRLDIGTHPGVRAAYRRSIVPLTR